MTAKGTETVVVRKPPEEDRFGNKKPGAVVGSLERCIIWPRSSTEESNRGIVGVDGYHVWAPEPYAVTPDAADIVEIRGVSYNIEGQPGDWRNRRGKKKGLLFETSRYS